MYKNIYLEINIKIYNNFSIFTEKIFRIKNTK